MNQRQWLEFLPLRVYVTIGMFNPYSGEDVVKANRVAVDIGNYPDTVITATEKLREDIAKDITFKWLVDDHVSADYLYFMVYRTADMRERPYLFSDNSPEHAEAVKALKEKIRRDNMTILQRIREDITWALRK